MNSLPTSSGDTQPPFVAEGGVAFRVSEAAEPFEAWIQLMEVIEALCPRWPPREPSIGGTYRL